ncbi:MAG: hypothetical protein V3S98_07690, partial [Dehalococcoidia bacterium]
MATGNGHKLYIGTTDGLFIGTQEAGTFAARSVGFEGQGDFRAAVVVDHKDPNLMYAGTIRAGMFRSRNGGETWEEINNGLMHRTVWSITQDLRTSDLYVGTSPAAVFISKDQGDSWSECESLEQLPGTKGWTGPVPPHVSRMKGLALSDDSPPVIYGAIEEGWAVKSPDGGATWEQIDDGVDHDGHSVVVDPRDRDLVLAATGKGMFISTNGGKHWDPTSEGLEGRRYTATPLVGHPQRPGLVLSGVTAVGPGQWRRPEGGDSGVARSDDGGRSWRVSTKGLPTPCVGVPRGLAVAPDDPDLCFVGLMDGTVWRSTDGAGSFEKVLDGL